jgi:hypothetical protein
MISSVILVHGKISILITKICRNNCRIQSDLATGTLSARVFQFLGIDQTAGKMCSEKRQLQVPIFSEIFSMAKALVTLAKQV